MLCVKDEKWQSWWHTYDMSNVCQLRKLKNLSKNNILVWKTVFNYFLVDIFVLIYIDKYIYVGYRITYFIVSL